MNPQDRRAQIVCAARSVFLDYGFAGTRVKDIADRAGITENLVYVRFNNKDEIYQAAVTDPLDQLVDGLISATHELTNADRGEVFERFHAVLYANMLDIAPLLAAALFSVPEHGRLYYTDTVLPKFTKAITAVIADVTGWDVDSLGLDVLVEGVLGLHFGLALDSIFAERALPAHDVAHTLRIIFGDGMRPTLAGRRPPSALPRCEPTAPQHVPAEQGVRLTAVERRAQIALAAREVFLDRGLAMSRTRDIAERAGITEAFMFRLFDGKEDLYRTAIEVPAADLMTQWAREMTDISSAGLDAEGTLQAINERGILILEGLAPMLVVALFSNMKRGKEFYQDLVGPSLSNIPASKSLTTWHGAGMRTEITWRAIFGIQLGTVLHHRLTSIVIDPVDVARQLTHMVMTGIRTGTTSNAKCS